MNSLEVGDKIVRCNVPNPVTGQPIKILILEIERVTAKFAFAGDFAFERQYKESDEIIPKDKWEKKQKRFWKIATEQDELFKKEQEFYQLFKEVKNKIPLENWQELIATLEFVKIKTQDFI